ncbi:MAG: agmatine deiminase [Gemmatales bacterium]|nr:MAG: agmatine deiminase [Gemmatales bacterium]
MNGPRQWRMPAEWERHEATWIAWPHNRRDWPGKFAPIPWIYAEIVRVLSRFENVFILVNNAKGENQAREILELCDVNWRNISFYSFATNRVWTRDYGPIFVKDDSGTVAVTDWKFTAWAKYSDWKRDNRIPSRIARQLHLPHIVPRLGKRHVVLEGGAIDVNGEGLLLATEECLLSDIQPRNPAMSRHDYEQVFARYLGVQRVFWLGKGIVGDDTHGHVDDLARFVNRKTVVAVVEHNASDENYEALKENWDRLQDLRTPAGEKVDTVALPMPAPVVFAGQRLPASYANFYIANECVLVPTFNDPNDRIALGTLSEVFPDRQVIGIHSVDLVWGFGTLHCLTQQQPVYGVTNPHTASIATDV